jgi:hypothetical protein
MTEQNTIGDVLGMALRRACGSEDFANREM